MAIDMPQAVVFRRPSLPQMLLSGGALLAIAGLAPRITLIAGQLYGHSTVPFILVIWCLLLGVCSGWFNHALFSRWWTFVPFAGALITILVIWLWQKLAFNSLVPGRTLTYGYLLTPAGAKAKFWVLSCPFWAGLACLVLCCILASMLWWRAGARGLLAWIAVWWLAAIVIFALPSMYLEVQGNSSIFI